MAQLEQISLEEAVHLGAVDDSFFGRFFFPRAFKQESPRFHTFIDAALSDPSHKYVSAMLFRGAAKTTKLRAYIAKRIAYGISRTILVVGKSQEAAAKTVQWVKNAVEYNKKYAGCFGLTKGNKWTETDCEIISTMFRDENGAPVTIRILAFGMTGSIRGVNIEDCRPDLIVVDDPCDEENTATAEQRKKMSDLFFGALAKSLAPTSESPHAKMVLLQTVLNSDDLISMCERDPTWHSLRIGCFNSEGESIWPERWSTEELLADKQAHIARGQLPLWMKEMECSVISDELAAFKMEHLQYWDHLPEGGITFFSIDPTPPPREGTAHKVNTKLDDFVIMVLRVVEKRIFVCDYYTCKSPDPGEFITKLFLMAAEWRCRTVVIETVLFARTLKWILEQEMIRRGDYLTIVPIEDKRNKQVRIRQEISARTTNRILYVHQSMSKLLEQYSLYPVVNHDDVLDALAIGLMHVKPWMFMANVIEGEYTVVEDTALLEDWRAAP